MGAVYSFLLLLSSDCSFDAATFATASDGVLYFSIYLFLCMYVCMKNVCSSTFVLTRWLFTVWLYVSCSLCVRITWMVFESYIHSPSISLIFCLFRSCFPKHDKKKVCIERARRESPLHLRPALKNELLDKLESTMYSWNGFEKILQYC